MGSRTKTGCITCRIRKVKCDETKPQCLKCQTSRRVCDGYLADGMNMSRRQLAATVRELSVLGPVSRALTRSPTSTNPMSGPVSPNDTIYFDLFRCGTVPSTCSFFPSDFWNGQVMQLAHSEPAIWHVTVALGALHQRAELLVASKKKEDEALVRRAEAHYAKAMALAKELETTTKIATLSIALVAAAGMLNRWPDMQKHIMAGLKIAASQQRALNDPTSRIIEDSLMRTDLQAMTFSASDSPYPYEDSAAAYAVDQFLMTPPLPSNSLEELSSEFFGMARSYFLLDDGVLSGAVAYGPWVTKTDSFMRRLVQWERMMGRYEESHQLSEAELTASFSLRMYHCMYRMLIQGGPFGPETRFDHLLGYFEYTVRLAATVLARTQRGNAVGLSLEPGIIIPLWMVAHRCRHHSVRHAAIRLLTNSHRVEAMWRSDGVAAIMEVLVAAEEETLGVISAPSYEPPLLDAFPMDIPWSAWSRPTFNVPPSVDWGRVPMIPEEKRVRQLLGTPNLVERRVHIRLMMCPENMEDAYGEVRDVVVEF